MSSLTYDLTLAGLSVGAAAALTGIGLIVTYRATGVLNFAHGAIAMLCAYLLRQLVVVWEVPLWAAAALVLLVVAPGFGLALERWVFRPLAVSGGDPARTLVASIGVFVLLVGAAALLWGTGAQEDAPRLLPGEPWGQLAVACAIGGAVWAVTRWTRFGGELRAVVDNRPLAVLGGIDADRVAAAGWAFGTFTAGLTGVLLAPYVRLDPYGLPLLVMEVVAVAVAAGMRRLGVAVGAALAIGVAQSQLTRLHPRGWAEPLVQAVGANLFVVALLVAALALPGVGGKGALPTAVTRRTRAAPREAWLVAGVLFLLPLGFAGSDLRTSIQVPALALILLSLVLVTGRAGQLALGQGAFAGLGALFATLLATGRFPGLPQLPGLAALLVAVLLVAPLGLLTAAPAIRRHGLALALATFAVGVGVSRFVFAQPYATSGLTPPRPAGFGDDRAFYILELALLAGALMVVAGLRRGRVGRALAAVRDHEAGASAAGVGVPALKVAVFVVGAGLAALGGGLLTFGLHSFDPSAYDPIRGLLWFAAIVVLGADSPFAALLGAGLLVGLDAGARGGVAALAIGVLAVLVGRGLGVRGWGRGRGRLTGRGAAARETLAFKAPAAFEQAFQAPATFQAPAAIEQRGPGRSPVTWVRTTATRPAPATLTATHLTVTYGPHPALQDVRIRLPSGSVTAVVGPNGAGKSTLFHCLAGTVRPDTGRVRLGQRDVTRLPAHTRTRLGIARTFQQLVVFPSLTVAENIRIGAEQGRVQDPAATERMTRLFGLRGEQETRGLPTGTLRRVELARALAGDPHVLLLDEPTAGLDPAEVAALARLLRALAADGVAVLVVEHDLDLVAELADTVHVMAAGRIVESGAPDSVLDRTPEPS
ncbi:ATP-binding cassette domain-containing protein [Streptomyces sp. NBC_00006]|uniref:ABC transporter permease subunit n=1 Tax=Streptomyces sp. NBC_00006 TaxID=2975619 RepID=UPI00225825A4|nr:ATP-binding cassette domain-containing protein [Streptomyces sp. NBC_00006]MCX5534463.1 ATP-binding cassette domain-containing protein [Streptomyces sp. NBC_00006]